MTVNEAITKLRVMLGASTEEVIETTVKMEEEITETVETTMAEAILVDGTKVYTEGDLAIGGTLYVSTEEDEDPFAPEGMHETTEGLLVSVGANGEITSIEEKTTEETSTEEVVEEVMEEEEVIETKEEVAFDATSLLEAIAALINDYKEEVKEEMGALTERFNSIADEPATKPVRNNFTEDARTIKNNAEARLENLIAIRRGKK